MLKLNLPLAPRFILPPIVLSIILTGLMLLPPDIRQMFYLSATEIPTFTLITSQLIHHSWSHLLLNIGGLWLWWLLFAESFPQWRYWLILPALMILSSLGEWFLNDDLGFYAGFSGCLYGLFAFSGVCELRQRKIIGGLVLMGLITKLVIDILIPENAEGLALSAHAAGIIGGMAFACIRPHTSL